MTRSSRRHHRVTLALKWSILDDCTASEIRQKFIDNGYGEYAESTIRNYLSEEEDEEVIERLTPERAKVRARGIERHERLYERAREAEQNATQDEPIQRVVPQTTRVKKQQGYYEQSDHEFVEPGDDDWPEWATEGDTILRFTDGIAGYEVGEEYPTRAFDGSPRYTTEFAGLERDVPDRTERSFLRREQSSHMEQQGEAALIYEDNVNINHSGEVDTTVALDPETAAAIREADLGSNMEHDSE